VCEGVNIASLHLCNIQRVSVGHTRSNNHNAAGIVAETEMACGRIVAADSPAAARKEKFQNSGVTSGKIGLHSPKNLLSAIGYPLWLSDNRYLCTLY
jgi:hypothetical protein